jgi:hypothetical protein
MSVSSLGAQKPMVGPPHDACFVREERHRLSGVLTGDFDAATRNIMTSPETYFSCRNCDALYKIIKAEGDPEGTDRIVSCLVCGASWSEVNPMRKTLIALVAAATVLATTFASSNKADAWWGWWPGAVIGGVVAGAIVGSTVAPRPYNPYGYYGPYYGPYPYGPRCPRVWNGYARVPAC